MVSFEKASQDHPLGQPTRDRQTNQIGFSGSYDKEDVVFLLKPITLEPTSIEEKEREIQSGRKHYSEMISVELPPSEKHLSAFRAALSLNRVRLGRDIAALAKNLAQRRDGKEVVLVSFARAGTPIGVLLRRALTVLGRKVYHYSISIIRDRGIDHVALQSILSQHPMEALVFMDGWTGKGGIHGAFIRSMANQPQALQNAPFCVVSDLAGCACLAASHQDYAIPSALLNSIVSGLISRTILDKAHTGVEDFHGCLMLDHLTPWDQSRWFVDEQMKDICVALKDDTVLPARWHDLQRLSTARISRAFLQEIMLRMKIDNPNRIKPGIGEATRALLRRVPDRLFVQNKAGEDIHHLLDLAHEKKVIVEVDAQLPYRACAIIRPVGEDG